MLRDRYEPRDVFAVVPALSFTLDRVLAQLDTLLDDDTLFQAVKADLAKRFPRTLIDGRPSTPVEVILRLLVIKHLYHWSYAQTVHWVSDSLVLRHFCRIYFERVPDATTLLRWANLIQPETLHAVLDHVVEFARQLKVTHGRKRRIDGTVVETNIHHPSDSTLLYDGVRVLGRTLRKAKQILREAPPAARKLFRDRTRSAKRQMKRIMETARQRGDAAEQALHAAYQQLLAVTEAMVDQAQQGGPPCTSRRATRHGGCARRWRTTFPWWSRSCARRPGACSTASRCPRARKSSACSSRRRRLFAKASRASRPSLGASCGWMKSKGGSSAAMTSWRGIRMRRPNCRRVWTPPAGLWPAAQPPRGRSRDLLT